MEVATFEVYDNLTEAEEARTLKASRTTYTERFYTLMRLIKVSAMIKNATILSSPVLPEKK